MAVHSGPVDALELKIPPALLVLLAAGALYGVDRLAPWARLELPGLSWLYVVLVALGVLCALAGVLAFRRARTTVDPTDPGKASRLVSFGIYRFTRNPMYLGFALVLLGGVARFGNPLGLLVVAAFVAWLQRFQIAPEERWMARRFGEEWQAYRSRVRRWF